jgi:hypothetical protein
MRCGYFAMPLHPPGADPAQTMEDRSSWRIARDVYVADTNARARREALEGPLARDYRDYFLRLLRKTRGLEIVKVDPAMADSDVTLEYLLDNVRIVGGSMVLLREQVLPRLAA